MEEKDDFKMRIKNVLEGLANMTEDELEEARQILRNEGKNPEKVVSQAMKQLKYIQQRRGSNQSDSQIVSGKNLTFPVLVSDRATTQIKLTYRVDENRKVLIASEVYAMFIQQKPNAYPVASSDIVETVTFRKITREIVAQIDFSKKMPVVNFYFSKTNELIDVRDIAVLVDTGYIISDLVWYPIEPKSLEIVRDLFSHFQSGNMLDLKVALEFYFNRHKYRTVVFNPEQLTLENIEQDSFADHPGDFFVRDLYKYQKDGLKWFQHCCITGTGGILGDDMGLGKTAQAIAMIGWALSQKLFERYLIVVPGTLIENWRREFEFFAPAVKTYIHHGADRTGSVTLLSSKQVVITSYSMVINDLYLLNKVSWGVVIADEASLLKNPDSERRTSLKAIPSVVKFVMTGTPVENSLMDLWSLADLTNEGFLGSRSEFSSRYIKRDIDTTISEADLVKLRKDTSLIMLRRRKEDVLDSLPERVDIHQVLTMGHREAESYDLQRTSILNQASDGNGATVLALIQELRKFTTHPMLTTGEAMVKADIRELSNRSIKFARTIELLDEIKSNQEKVLIFTEYLDMIDTFSRILGEHYNVPVFTIDGRIPTEQRQVNIDLFTNARGFSIMILNPRTAGMGLNITAANHVIHYTRQWNPALEEQATARAYRNRQTKNVNVYYLFYEGTIEQIIDERLLAKRKLSSEVIVATPDEPDMAEYLETLKLSPLQKHNDI